MQRKSRPLYSELKIPRRCQRQKARRLVQTRSAGCAGKCSKVTYAGKEEIEGAQTAPEMAAMKAQIDEQV